MSFNFFMINWNTMEDLPNGNQFVNYYTFNECYSNLFGIFNESICNYQQNLQNQGYCGVNVINQTEINTIEAGECLNGGEINLEGNFASKSLFIKKNAKPKQEDDSFHP